MFSRAIPARSLLTSSTFQMQRRGVAGITLKEVKVRACVDPPLPSDPRSSFILQYSAPATASGKGRSGTVTSEPEGTKPITITLSLPKCIHNGTGESNNPEQLFAVGYSGKSFLSLFISNVTNFICVNLACFLASLRIAASMAEKPDVITDAKVTTTVHIGPANEMEGYGLAVDIEVENVADEGIVKAAHGVSKFFSVVSVDFIDVSF